MSSLPPAIESKAYLRRRAWLVAGLLVVATMVAYHNSFSVPFFFDDRPAIERNESIRHLWPLSIPLSPPITGAGVAGRPLTNLTLAFNYAASGLNVWSYHWLNLAIHLLGGLTLWSLLRHTLRSPFLRGRFDQSVEWAAGGAALLWLVHPLQTESVVCVVQRNELLAGLFYLLTLHCFIRSTESDGPLRWRIGAVIACALGMASKEVMVTAPLVIFLYDRTFVAGTFAQAWRQRGRFHLALAGTWALLAWLMLQNQQRAGTVGFGLGISAWDYLLTQCAALALYLKLSLWPHPLVTDYGIEVARTMGAVWAPGLLVLALLAATIFALWRRPVLGFAGAWFFAILAPSSSFVPLTTQTMAEHRMYLPLAAVIILAVAALARSARSVRVAAVAVLAVALVVLTVRRNFEYRDEETIWMDTIAKRPGNARAHASLAGVYARHERWREALPLYEEALRLRPDYADAQNDYANALGKVGRTEEAARHLEIALRLKPDDADIRFNLGIALVQAGKPHDAIAHFERVAQERPTSVDALNHLGDALLKSNRPTDALDRFRRGLQLDPSSVAAHNNTAVALVTLGRPEEAIRHYETAARLQPDNFEIRNSFAETLLRAGQAAEAAGEYVTAVKLKPASPELRYNLANVWLQLNRLDEAVAEYSAALRLRPDWAPAHHNLALAFTRQGRAAEAIPHFEETLRQLPDSAQVHHNLALALAAAGRRTEAIAHDETALRLQPNFAEARQHLLRLRGP